ncbi:hypothetical protein [Blastochloris viridis]|uniref:Uncharacterized protein n=1 Tax=Blastochloris viridis TaxID=1079 RepID=A0A0H5BC69_BLAVI|nr:hypothetical protein [Blastochloris viridis]ALK10216.1 hypothetical protein BVIR_2449 [Blastochloris viridis]BAR99852.1 hypothetical protein BV133_2259 [Blastochloris viridis]CUU42880.1 hypothetical protein BVIRIDIS_18950 [Blastochloris viridis]
MTKQAKTVLIAVLLTPVVIALFAPPPFSVWALGWLAVVVVGVLVGAVMVGRTRR